MGLVNVSMERVREAAADVGRALGCRLILLFGSAVAAEPRVPEDLDIGILAGRDLDTLEATNRLIRALGTQPIDVVDLRRADPLLLMLAARDGTPLFQAEPGEFARFVSLAARRYADTRKFREMERREIQDFLARSRA